VILRPDGDGEGVVAIGQASHAWLAGQLASAWGNDRFAAPAPREEVVLGATQHDIGMADWDLRPQLNPETGLPLQFFELDRRTHLALWTAAPQRVLSQSRYAALLVSLHGTGLYERFPPKSDDPEILAAVADYVTGQVALQRQLAQELGLGDDEMTRNQALLAVFDDISLAICTGAREPHAVPGAPATNEGDGGVRVPLTLTPSDAATNTYALDPWPFAREQLVLRAEGRRLAGGPYADEPALHEALAAAQVVTVQAVIDAPR
jgi:hypothetical protein